MSVWLDRLASQRWPWFTLIALALGVRLAFVLTAPLELPWVDGAAYEEVGHRLVTERAYTGTPRYPPAYPFLIASVYALVGRELLILRIVEALLATGTVALVGWFGARLFSRSAGLIALALAAAHPVMAFLPVTQYTENLLMFLLVLAFGTFGLAMLDPRPWRWALSGALFGLGILCKPAVLALLPGLAVGAWFGLGRKASPRLRHAVAFTVLLLAVLAPWIARNQAVHGVAFVTRGGGLEFWLANNPDATTATDWKPERPQWLIDSLWVLRDDLDAQDGLYHREGWRFYREQPGRALFLYAARVGNIWSFYPRTMTKTRYSSALADWAQGICSAVVFLGAILGLRHMGRRGLWALPLGVLTFTLAAALFFTVMRYRMSVEIVLLWAAGLGFVWLAGRLDRKAVTPRGS